MNTAKAYDKLVEKYAAIYGQNTEYNYFLDQLTSIVHKGKILDLGCGTGEPVARDLVQHGYEVVGVDFSKKMIAAAVGNVPKATFLYEDILKLELDPESFDAACAFFSFTHIKKKELPKLVKRLFDALKERGAILIGVTEGEFEGKGEILGEEVYISEFSEDELRILLNDFRIEMIEKREFRPQEQEESETQIYILATKPSLSDAPEEDIQAVLAKSPEEELEVTKTIEQVDEDIDSMIDKIADQIHVQENEPWQAPPEEQSSEEVEQEIDSIAKESEASPESAAAPTEQPDVNEIDLDKELASPQREHTREKMVEESGKWREKVVILQPEPARVVKSKHAAEQESVVVPVNYEEPKKVKAEKPEQKEFKDLLDKLIAVPPRKEANEPEDEEAQSEDDDEEAEEKRAAESRHAHKKTKELRIAIKQLKDEDDEDGESEDSGDERKNGDRDVEKKEDGASRHKDHKKKNEEDDDDEKPLLRIRF